MTTSRVQSALSRRRFVKGATVAAGAAAAGAGPSQTLASDTSSTATTLVAATVVRASHARNIPGALSLGVRVSVRSSSFSTDKVVVIIEPVPFGASPTEIGRQITEGVRREVMSLMERRGELTRPEEIAVQVFGGAL